jgi:uncharacterized membrane protein (UPF0127 family)
LPSSGFTGYFTVMQTGHDWSGFLAVLLAVWTAACAAAPLPTTQLTVRNTVITVEIADQPAARTQGLSDRDSLWPDHGMLFVFPTPSRLSFWMYHCFFSIDLAYLDKNGVVRDIFTMRQEPDDTPEAELLRYPSQTDQMLYALEMTGGWFARHGVQAGDTVDVKRFRTSR